MTLESIENLRTVARNMAKGRNLEHHEDCNLLLIVANEIEREIAEKYMELPVDAEGVPIRCGDVVDGGMGDSGKVQHVELWPDGFVVVYECHPGTFTRYAPDAVRHVKERTIEDVLEEFAHEWNDTHHDDMPALKARYADELRSMGVGE